MGTTLIIRLEKGVERKKITYFQLGRMWGSCEEITKG